MAEEKVTIYTIAKEAGVSPATVSRVLTGSASVRSEKREKIQELIDKYHFIPNALAKGLTDTTRHTIGIIAADVQNPYYAAMFSGCEKAANKRGYTVMVFDSQGDTKKEESRLQILCQHRVDAIIQMGGSVDDLVTNPDYAAIVSRITERLPVVVTGKLDGTSCFRISINESKAVELLMEHLLSLGHQKIALVGGRLDVTSTYEKYQRYIEILNKNRIEFHPEYIIGGGYSYEDGYKGIKKILSLPNLPTAVIAINDMAAAGIIRGTMESGLRIPDDISIASYDNTYIARCLLPSLTSIDYNYEKYGELLINTAIKAAEGKEMPQQVQKIEPKLIIRESSGAVSVDA